MRSRSISEVLIRTAVRVSAERTDADLLGRFVCDRDAVAFEALVRRHGPMVLGVCRRALGDTPDADDAFQTVWLVLVRKARSIAPRAKVGNWLYGVAARTAAHARARNARRHAAQRPLFEVSDSRLPDPDTQDVAAAIDAELVRLPERYRVVIVLCELERRPLKHVAEQLGLPLGTVASRLSRGRALLATRLRARGFGFAALGGALTSATTPVSARLVSGTVSVLQIGSQEVARSVTELTHGVLSVMLANKLKAIGHGIAATALAVGAMVWTTTVTLPALSAAQQADTPAKQRDTPRPRAVREAFGLQAARADGEHPEPPSDAEVLRAMARVPRAVPHVYEELRDDIVIVKNRLGPRVVRLSLWAGVSVKLKTELWECNVYYKRTIESDYPFPMRVRLPQKEVVEIHKLKSAK